jgi:hypothetical protein
MLPVHATATGPARTKPFTVEGNESAARSLRAFQQFATAVRNQGLRTLAAKVKQQTRQRFLTTKQSPDGEPWRPWSPGYAATRQRKHSLLIDTRMLLKTLATKASAGGLLFGSPRPYAAKVQAIRPFLGIGQGDVPELQKTLDDWSEKEMSRRGYA